MKEWEKHVAKEKGLAYCGAKISWFDWHLQDIEHAKSCVEQDTRIQPCPKCWKQINNS
jgi:hypothetical protein